MKIIVVSDSHGKDEVLDKVVEQYPHADMFIHCGDIEADEARFPQFITVLGNNDLFYDYPEYRIIEADAHRILVIHSHQFMYHARGEQMAKRARGLGCDIVCYGHTHVAADDTVDGVRLINPGSIWRSRDGREPSYAIMDLEHGEVSISFEFLPQKKSRFFF